MKLQDFLENGLKGIKVDCQNNVESTSSSVHFTLGEEEVGVIYMKIKGTKMDVLIDSKSDNFPKETCQTLYKTWLLEKSNFRMDFLFGNLIFGSIYEENIKEVLRSITKEEGDIIRSVHGLEGAERKNFEELSLIYGYSKERVRRIHAKGMRRLRHPSRHPNISKFLVEI